MLGKYARQELNHIPSPFGVPLRTPPPGQAVILLTLPCPKFTYDLWWNKILAHRKWVEGGEGRAGW